jgi:hypothetical protein
VWCILNVPSGSVSNSDTSNVVDIFDVKTGAWTTAALSAARYNLAATSLPSDGVALFAGGWGALLSFHFLITCGINGEDWDTFTTIS